MDWTLVWTAVGAIGTSVGSLITAITVVVAVRQYLQPITKKIEVAYGSSIPVFDNKLGDHYIHIKVNNRGLREITINSFDMFYKKKTFFINRAQANLGSLIEFPFVLTPGQSCTFFMSHDNLKGALNEYVKDKTLRRQARLSFGIIDASGDTHRCRKKLSVAKMLRG